VSYLEPALLGASHSVDEFACGDEELERWLRTRARTNQATGTSRTWVITEEGSGKVIAFYASATSSLLRSSAPRPLRRNQPEQIPAVLLARLGVDLQHQGQGLAGELLRHLTSKVQELSSHVGVQLMVVHAKNADARNFYGHYGFTSSPIDELVMMRRVPVDDIS